MTISTNDRRPTLKLFETSWDSANSERQNSSSTDLLETNIHDDVSRLSTPSYHTRRQRRSRRNANNGLKNTTTKKRRRRSSNRESPRCTDANSPPSEKGNLKTYKIRLMHSGRGRLEEEASKTNQRNAVDSNQPKNPTQERVEQTANHKTCEEGYPNSAKTAQEIEGLRKEIRNVQKDRATYTSNSLWARETNLPRLPELQRNTTRNSSGKFIHDLTGSKSSSWILVGPHGNHFLRQPTPIPSDAFHTHTKPLPPINEKFMAQVRKSSDWSLKTNKVTLSALLQVDPKQACIRDQSLEFGKELLLQSKIETKAPPEPPDKAEPVKVNNDDKSRKPEQSLDEEHAHRRIPVIVLPPLQSPKKKRQDTIRSTIKQAVKEQRSECTKQRCLPRNARSTLPEVLPDICDEQEATKMPSDNCSTDSDETQSSCTSDEDEDASRESSYASGSSSRSCEEINNCVNPILTDRSESEFRERLVDIMDFECQNEPTCTFEDDNTLRRAVVLRNIAIHPQTPPPSPYEDTYSDEMSRSGCIIDPAMMKSNNQLSDGYFDECSYPEQSHKKPKMMDQLRPTLRELEKLIDNSLASVSFESDPEEERLAHCNDIKAVKSVRFADLPPKHKTLSRSKSDSSADSKTMKRSAEWNECFLMAVGENRAIKKEVRHHSRSCKPDLLNDNRDCSDDDDDDDLGAELIEREMKRYIHWLRHDRAAEQHRWFSSNVACHRNLPLATHHVPQQMYATNSQLSPTSLSVKVAKAIGLYSVLPKSEPEAPPAVLRPVRFPKVPVLSPIAGGSSEVLLSKTFTGEVKGLPVMSKLKRKKRRSKGRK